jgi:hypothetical protein
MRLAAAGWTIDGLRPSSAHRIIGSGGDPVIRPQHSKPDRRGPEVAGGAVPALVPDVLDTVLTVRPPAGARIALRCEGRRCLAPGARKAVRCPG